MASKIGFAPLAWAAVAAPCAVAQSTLHASLTTAGVDADRDCNSPSISAEGRFVAFDTTDKLESPDTNSNRDVYLRDTVAGTLVVVSRATTGKVGSRTSQKSCVSAGGLFVHFESDATDLITGDTNAASDIYRRDVAASVTTRVSVSSAGAQGNGGSANASASADGAFVVFDSLASNLVTGDANGAADVFLRDVAAGTTVRISVKSDGGEANGRSLDPSVSADGNLVVFKTYATNLATNDNNGFADIYLRDRAAGTTRRLSLSTTGGNPTNDCFDPVISADGRFVAFSSYSDNLVVGDNNGIHDVFVVDVATGVIERASLNTDGYESGGQSGGASLSDDGRFVGFTSWGPNLAEGDWNNQPDFFVRDRQMAMTSWLSIGDVIKTGKWDHEAGAVCGDGSRAVFNSANPLVATDLDAAHQDVFVRVRDFTPASWSNYGVGLAGTLGVPSLDLSAPPVLNGSFDLRVGNSTRWYAVAVLLVGTSQASAPAFGGTLLVDPAFSIALALYPGTTAFAQEVPPDDLLAGETLYAQVIELDPGAPEGVSMTAGVAATLGF